jgi:hypothetical protein
MDNTPLFLQLVQSYEQSHGGLGRPQPAAALFSASSFTRAAAEVGRDLHSTASKVQQLTKVIYHLNAKGEDADDVPGQAQTYENEIEAILRDAGDRVKRFQASCSHETDMKLIEKKVREVEVRYEGEKLKALRDIDEFKKRSEKAQDKIKQEAEAKVAALAKELEAQKREFAARVKEFSECMEGLEKKAKSSEEGEKKRAASELADVVRKHNAKFNEMLQQRMAEEEALRRRLEA